VIPIVETERLILRGMVKADFPAFATIWQEPGVVRYIGGKPRPLSESWASFLKIAGSWAIEGFGQWAIVRREDGRLIGQAGFFTGARGIGEDFDAAPEAGWVLTTGVQGQGLGGEAVTAAHRWFDAQDFGGRSHAMIEVGHGASLALARRLGYRAMRETEETGDRVVLLSRARPDGG